MGPEHLSTSSEYFYIYTRPVAMGDLSRFTFDEGRVYHDGQQWMPSVSTVLDVPGDPPALKKYKQRTSEEERNWTKFYTQNRGTLIHYTLLSQLVDEEFWSADEQSSEDQLRGKETHQNGVTGDYETWQQYQADKEWALDTWELIKKLHNIRPENTLNVELFVTNRDVGYAGQFDLLRIDENGDVRLSDIKTSKRVYDKHLKQCVAYKHAVPIAVDGMDVIRINPDGKTWEVSHSENWIEDEAELWDEFVGYREQLEQDLLDDLVSQAKQLADG